MLFLKQELCYYLYRRNYVSPKKKNTNANCMRKGDNMNDKYLCKMCGQIVEPLPDGSCPVCGAPREMLVPAPDQDEER